MDKKLKQPFMTVGDKIYIIYIVVICVQYF